MVNTRIIWRFFLQDNGSGQCYKIDDNGMIKKGNPLLKEDYGLKHHPEGWEDMQLTFARNKHYWAMNRSFSNSFKFVADGAQILRSLLYTGKGIEAGVTLLILKWDQATGEYRLYYSGQIDFSKSADEAVTGLTVDTLEGGVSQLLKTYENTIHEIPCDGSQPYHVKVNADGILFNDVFHYQILPVTNNGFSNCTVPCAFVSNEGDNIGISKNDSVQFDDLASPFVPINYIYTSSNFVISSQAPITIRLRGTISVKMDRTGGANQFTMFTRTNLSQPDPITGVYSNSYNLVPGAADPNAFTAINGQQVFYFDKIIPLQANENLFIFFACGDSSHHCQILGGSFSMSFSSRYPSSRVWGMTMWDLFKEVVRRNNLLASTTNQPFNFAAASALLQEKLNVIITSGDAARASTDPNYFQYFNQATINPANPGNQNYNPFPFIGPAIKTSLADLFDTANPLWCAAMGNQRLAGQQETLFLERKSYVFNPSVVTMTLNRVANLKVSIALDYFFNWLKIGYIAQQYDEKAGKFEYNTTFQWQAPIKTMAKVLELVCKYRADSYGFEYTRQNTSGGKSTTFNDSDSSVFMLNADFTQFIYDYFEASFKSILPDPSSDANQNQRLVANQDYQPVVLSKIDGEYFVNGLDFSIFMFNQASPGTKTVVVNFTSLLNGLPGDSATIKMFINGTVVQQWSQAITGVNTSFNQNVTFSRAFAHGDNVWFTIDTIRTCAVTITQFILQVGGTYLVAQSVGNIDIPATSTSQMISLPQITTDFVIPHGTAHIPVVSSGFQYFRFLSPITNAGFDYTAGFSFWINAGTGLPIHFDMWKNGVNVGTFTATSSGNIYVPHNQPDAQGKVPVMFSGHFDFDLYDLIWFTTSVDNTNLWINQADFKLTSNSIKAYSLLRKNYDSVRGIPNPQTAYNIEEFTPRRMFEQNKGLLASALFSLAPGQITFQTSDKNQYLSTTLAGQTITENAAVDVHDLGDPLFYPFLLDLDTEVDVNFNDLLNGQANGHIEVLWGDKKLYGYPIQVSSKPAYNESQSWKLLLSTRTNLADLNGLDWDGLIPLQPMDSLIPNLSPVHFVPLDYQQDPRFNGASMDEDWYKNRIADWLENGDFFNPWQQNDVLSFQFQSNGLTPVSLQVLDGDGNPVGNPINVPDVTSPALPIGQTLFQLDQPLAGFAEGSYYFLVSFGVGEAMAKWISEPIQVKAKWDDTILIQYKHTRNMLGVVFSGGYSPSYRIHGKVMRFTPKSKYAQFADEQQDMDMLNAFSYRTWKLQIGHKDGLVPDYVLDLMENIMDLDTVFINGAQITRDAEANFEQQTFAGEPKVIATIDIRKAKNSNANILNTAGQLTTDMLAGYTVDPAAFGQSLVGQDVTQITNT
jgi:hypothetical protein